MNDNNNKLIAKFMGFEYKTGVSLGGNWHRFYKINGKWDDSFPEAYYHKYWDWLMPVIEEIERLGYIFMIGSNTAGITCGKSSGLLRPNISTKQDSKILAAYIACIDFIEFYNKNNLIVKQ